MTAGGGGGVVAFCWRRRTECEVEGTAQTVWRSCQDLPGVFVEKETRREARARDDGKHVHVTGMPTGRQTCAML